jgi:hypothetical protein
MGPCAKRRVVCILTIGNLVYKGENLCANPQEVCPRLEGEDYTKCRTICKQPFHAEMHALALADDSNRTDFGKAQIYGHTKVCRGCLKELKYANIEVLSVTPTIPEGM